MSNHYVMEGGGSPNFFKKNLKDAANAYWFSLSYGLSVVDKEPKYLIMLFNNCINAMEIATVTRTDKRGAWTYGFNS